MPEPTPYAISRFLSDLTGREVSAALVLNPPAGKVREIYGLYSRVESDLSLIVKADLSLLAMLGGALLGLPNEAAIEQSQQTPMGEPVRDAIHEVLNVTSTVLHATDRVVFRKFVLDSVFCSGADSDLLRAPAHKAFFNLSFGKQAAGQLAILS